MCLIKILIGVELVTKIDKKKQKNTWIFKFQSVEHK